MVRDWEAAARRLQATGRLVGPRRGAVRRAVRAWRAHMQAVAWVAWAARRGRLAAARRRRAVQLWREAAMLGVAFDLAIRWARGAWFGRGLRALQAARQRAAAAATVRGTCVRREVVRTWRDWRDLQSRANVGAAARR